MSRDILRVGIIGCGAIARYAHLPGYARENALVKVEAVAEIDEARASAVAREFDVPRVFTDYHKMLAEVELDAVSICTPNYLHASIAIDAMNAGKHVLCEKPMAVDLAGAKAMLKAARDNKVLLMVAFTHRFFNFNQKARDYIRDGVIGVPLTMRVRFAHEGPYVAWPAVSDWFFNPKMAGGGALLDMGIHAIDLCRYLGGEIACITAKVATLSKDIEVEDAAVGFIEFSHSGALGYFEVGWHSKQGPLGVEVYGTEGTMVVDYTTPLRVYKTNTALNCQGWIHPEGLSGGGWEAQIANFVRSALGREKPLATGEDGYRALKVALAAYESSAKGVKMAIDPER